MYMGKPYLVKSLPSGKPGGPTSLGYGLWMLSSTENALHHRTYNQSGRSAALVNE